MRVLITGIVLLGILAGCVSTVYNLVRQRMLFNQKEDALGQLEGGDYSGALMLYNKLKQDLPEDKEVTGQFEETKKMLVAEENYLKAKSAAEQEEWFAVEALLRESDAISDQGFRFYGEARAVYEQALEQLSLTEEQEYAKILNLQEQARKEKSAREQAEQKKAALESQLQQTHQQQQQTESTLQSTAALLEESQQKISETQSKFEEEQKKSEELQRLAETERLQTFLNEVDVYADMLDKGNEQLNLAIAEINSEKDVSALIFLSQAKVLFEEIYSKAVDLRDNRTPDAYQEYTNTTIESASLFKDSITAFRNAIIHIDNQNSDEFRNYFDQANGLKTEAWVLRNKVREYIDGH